MRYYRECREGGAPTGRKIYEMHDFCECENCKWRYKYLGARDIMLRNMERNNKLQYGIYF